MTAQESRKLRLMHLVLDLDPGGTQRLVIEMSKRLRQMADVRVCCLDDEGAWASELVGLGIPVIALRRRPGFRPSLAVRIARLAREAGTDVLHCHHYSPFVYGALAARLRPRTRLVYTEHGRTSDAPPSRKRRLANLLFARIPGSFCAVSRELRGHMIAEGFPGARVGVVYNGIAPDPAPTPQARAAARSSLGIPQDALVVGTIARLDPVKRLETLIGAFATFRRDHPRACLVLIGDGPERVSLERAAARTEAEDGIRFLGARDDARRLLPALDIYANTSVTEGVSVTILEAMDAALPVVASSVGGTPEVVLPESTGYLFPPGDVDSLVEALRTLAADVTLRTSMGAAGHRRIAASFHLGAMIQQYLRIYEPHAPPTSGSGL